MANSENAPGSQQEGERALVAPDRLDRREYGRTVRAHLLDFGALFGLILAAVGAWRSYAYFEVQQSAVWAAAAIALYSCGRFLPNALYWPWKGWMALAHVLGTVMTTLIVSVGWVALVLPTAFVVRLVGAKTLNMEFRTGAQSYWEKRDPKDDDFKLLERQF